MVDSLKPSGRLAAVTGKDVSIDPAEHCDGWAGTYDHDLTEGYGYCAPEIAARAFAAEVQDRGAEVMDLGCGTGLAARALAAFGFTCIDGVDISAGMLAEAEKTGLYRHLIRADGEAAAASATHDALICVGAFGRGHLGPGALPGLIGRVRPGGALVIFMNAEPFIDDGYAAHLTALEAGRRWRVLRVEDHNYMAALDRPGKLIVARAGA